MNEGRNTVFGSDRAHRFGLDPGQRVRGHSAEIQSSSAPFFLDVPARRLELRTWVSPVGTLIAAWWSAAWLTAVGVEHLPAGFY
jgi:hypothetical protein